MFKHFPGHGATAGDTHEGFAVADRTLDELKEEELVPFARAAEDGAECIMAAHISGAVQGTNQVTFNLSNT